MVSNNEQTYFVLYTLGLVHLCYSGCQIELPNRLFDRYSTIGTGHAFKVLSTADIWFCLEMCYRFSICRSVDFNRDQRTCSLNVRSAIEEPALLMTSNSTSHLAREDFPMIVSDECLHHSCNHQSMCLPGAGCVPVLIKICGSPPVVLNAEGTPPEGPFPVGHTHNYTCSVGYVAFWESYTTCQDNGKWSEVVFQCIDICIAQGNRRIGTWCYFLSTVKANRQNAINACATRGMYLSRIESSAEWNTLRPNLDKSYWIAGYAVYTFWPFRDFYWEPGYRIGYSPWAPGQPDNMLFNQFFIRTTTQGWDDENDGSSFYFLCEADC